MRTQIRQRLREVLPAQVYVTVRTARNAATKDHPQDVTAVLGKGRSGSAMCRPLEPGDADSWGAAMRANYTRMRPWWGLPEDMAVATDRVAFHEHRRTWQARARSGTGACMAIIGAGSVVGEIQLWNLQPQGLTCEVGLWLSPSSTVSIKQVGACLGFVLDRLINQLGIQRIDAPVACANHLPRRFLALSGFEVEATIPKWRELHGELVDYDLFTLTPARWEAAKIPGQRLVGSWELID
ncbi:GNAT family N-acetyltransferase [Gephyromycinifex aptenodytis]|uniref:GNAT family N-acetyltransferase n=1 Tax=Gephyromycinifex aptenodytis TaxID=2716227 RepID=UPI0014475C92|nr:GNAT family protein [Gephyromycinifex aptenodytis]